VPTHRSYIDFIILSYIFFGYGIKCPHIAAAEDFLNMAIIHILLRKSGAFFIRRDQQENRVLYKAIMTEYVTKLLMDKSHLEFFVEGTRSRVGKMLEPKYGILTMVVDAVQAHKIPNAYIVPITINYERVLEGATFPLELLG
jgi:1-acyl-sn-glycerol-3-phosphate acyltransferase